MGARIPCILLTTGLIAVGEATPDRVRPEPCQNRDTSVVVAIDTRTLHLCRGGRSETVYPVNLGQGGAGKRRQGDQKTPLGRYRLSPPRPSVSGFTWFVPIHYPTAAQKKAGYTGGAIGVHGPPDWMPRRVIDLAFATPWTDGCVMVRTTEEIETMRTWLLEHKPSVIEIIGTAAPSGSGAKEAAIAPTSPHPSLLSSEENAERANAPTVATSAPAR